MIRCATSQEYAKHGLTTHHHTLEDGCVPSRHQLFHSIGSCAYTKLL